MATRRRKKTETPKLVMGVRLDKVDETVLRKAYRLVQKEAAAMAEPPMAVEPDAKLGVEAMVETMVQWFRATAPAESLCDCTTCGGDSDARLSACPYCGDDDATIEVEGSEVEVEEPEPEEPEPEEPEPEKTPTKKTSKKTSKKTLKKTPKPKRKVHPNVSKKVEAEADEPEVEVIDKGALMVTDLDDAVTKVDVLKRSAAHGIWELGVQVKDILDRKLWRLRLDGAGKPAHKTFSQFCKTELGMSYSHANRLMAVAETFSKAEMERIGVAKCSIMLHVPPEIRAQLMDGAEGKSTSQLSDEAKALKGGEEPKVPRGALTVAMAPGIVDIPLMARPKNNARKGSDKPATSVTQDPWGLEQLPNKVHVYYAVTKNREGQLVLRVERRRVSREELFHDEEETPEVEED